MPIEAALEWLDSKPRAAMTGRALPARPSSPRTSVPDSAWQLEAACRDVPAATADAFTDAVTQQDGEALATQWCARCPVAEDCLQVGRETWAWGMHGGVVLIDGRATPRTAQLLSLETSRNASDVLLGDCVA